jgi:hypothetical protein
VNTRRSILAACALAATVAAAGCHEPVSVTVYEPGEYKGAGDPLLKKHAAPGQKEALQKRLAMGQTDR